MVICGLYVGYMWLYRVICGYTGLNVVIQGYMWLYRVICGYTGLYVVIQGYIGDRWLYVVIHIHTQSFSQDSMCKPTKLVSVVTRVKRDPDDPQAPAPPRPMSDGVVYGNFNERRIEYEEVLMSERTDSQFSQSESYISEGYAIRIVAMAVLLCMT